METPPITIANLTNDEMAALYAHRAAMEQRALEQRAQARPPADPPRPYQRSRPDGLVLVRPSKVSQLLTAILTLIACGMFAMLVARWLGWLPPQLLAPSPETSGQAPAQVAPPPLPVSRHAPGAAPVGAPAAPAVRYELTPPAGWRAAWSPDQEPTIDLGSWTYRIVQDGSPWQEIELSDGRRLWLRSPASVPPAPVADHPSAGNAPAPPMVDAQDMALPSANGTAGTQWATPDAPLPTPAPTVLPRPTAPLTFDPAQAGPGGSSGGSTWGQP